MNTPSNFLDTDSNLNNRLRHTTAYFSHPLRPHIKQVLACLTVSALLFAFGCSTAPKPQPEPTPTEAPTTQEESTAEALLERAVHATSPQRERLLFMASSRALEERRVGFAKRILAYLTYRTLDYSDKATYLSQRIHIALQEHDADTALKLFEDPRYQLNTFYNQLSYAEQARLGQLRAQAFELSGLAIEAIMERVYLTPLIADTEEEAILRNHNAIWRNLISLSPETTQALEQTLLQQYTPNQELAGWLALSQIHKTYSEDLSTQLTNIQAWQTAWEGHPASKTLPSDLAALIKAAQHQPSKVALILPQSGQLQRASRVFMDGFMSAYYHAHSQHIKTPTIELFDTTSGDIIDIYNAAVKSGAEIVIGPLDKMNVKRLSEYETLPVPTLALNYLDANMLSPMQLYQFGLAAEDEVKQIAQRAFLENHTHAAIIYPENEWGRRISKAFSESWEALTGKVVTQGGYTGNGDFSNLIKQMLNIPESQGRAKQLKTLLNEKVEFAPRRRQDIEFIVMLGTPRNGRQIVPTLAFHYAGDLPIYSTSSIYSGRPNPISDKDLNGVTFPELPWVLNEGDPIKEYLRQQVPDIPPGLTRLRAMGADAYRLHQQLAILTLGTHTTIKGSTGQLSLGDNNRMERRANWARFQSGKVKLDNSAPIEIDKGTDLPNNHPINLEKP